MKSTFRKPKVKDGPKQALDVYCRLRPASSPGPMCIKVMSPTTVHVIPPNNSAQLRNGPHQKEMQYSFRKVFGENVPQKDVFETVALPLVGNLLNGNNGLLFTYGVTGSGKTFTMTGSKTDGGIMPRCIDTIFNSIGLSNAGKYIFKPDKLNGFEVQSEADALMDRQQDLLLQLTPAKNKLPRLERMNTETEFLSRVPCDNKVNINEDSIYSVFVTFVEIYNNSVYDLLDEASSEGFRPTLKGPPQVKIIREDSDHNMFVHGVNEVEVKNADEAFQAFGLGQKRRKIAHTALNAESSRAHTIFTIRVVQAPTDNFGQVALDKKLLTTGQLSLVDLAGSERTKRTENTGQRLREAGNINNSLMTLRSCLEVLRENQKGANKIVPYRDSRLTHLFKSFFEGEGSVAMVVCANPRAEDYDENMHVLKFAEVSQEVQIFCPPTPKVNYACTPRRRRKLQGSDKSSKDSSPTIFITSANEFFSDIPAVGYLALEDTDDTLKQCTVYLEGHLQQFESFGTTINQRGLYIKESVINLDKNGFIASHEVEKMKALYEREKGRVADLETKVRSTDLQMNSYKRKIDEYEMNAKRLKRELSEKELLISKSKVDSSKVREQYNNKIAATEEKLKGEMERRLRSQKSALEFELRSKERKLREAKRVLSDESLRTVPSTPEPERFRPPAPCTPLSMRPPSPNFRSTGRRIIPTKKYRRSRSAESWLEHKPVAPTGLPTVLQPVMTRRRSVSKLGDAKDVLSSGADRYCLVTQGQDSDGDLEARIYKGDIVPTTSGGAQVTFSDVEILKQKSPTSPTRRKPADLKRNPEKACSIAVEGHRFRR